MCDALISADSGDRWVAVCTRERLAVQQIVCAKVASVAILVVQDGDTIIACERACPHEQADLSRGHISGGRLHCPHHRASFSLATGDISSGWPSRPLRRFPVQCDDLQVWVDTQALSS
jgi:3-phenylpropionate/trans-cinnamate dioxygenase ferredoxin subunit